jgi:hypothetical protein
MSYPTTFPPLLTIASSHDANKARESRENKVRSPKLSSNLSRPIG